MFRSETRRGWLANNCSWIGAPPDCAEDQYVALFIEWSRGKGFAEHRRRHPDVDLVEMADIARPSNLPTAHERETNRTLN
jgi:hypothetical protein